jgi:hypothetical protein
MLKDWKFKAIVPLAGAAMLSACAGADKRDDRSALDQSGAKTADARPLSLTGCVGTGPGNQQMYLTQVQMEPMSTQPSDAPSSSGSSITEHSQVRLAMADSDDKLTKLVGQRVTVTGTLRDDGRNTIGTAGREKSPQEAEPRVDVSQAGTDQRHSDKVRKEAGPIGNRSMNDGTFPEILVQRVSAKGEKCTPKPIEQR